MSSSHSSEGGGGQLSAPVVTAELVPLLGNVADEFNGLGHALDDLGLAGIAAHLHRAASAIDLALPDQPGWWSRAFNCQDGRTHLFLRLLDRLRPGMLVETGTFRGTTTDFMARNFAGPILTCEADPRWFATAQARLAGWANVETYLLDSRSFLRMVLARWRFGPLVYYLDAHWQADLPLREEIELIVEHGAPAVIMIDDFAVPGEPGYDFDDYGPGKKIAVELLAGIAPRGAQLFFPTLPASDETGARRGCAIIGLDDSVNVVLAEMAELRACPWPEEAGQDIAAAAAPDQAQARHRLERLVMPRAPDDAQLRAELAQLRGQATRHVAELAELREQATRHVAELAQLHGQMASLRQSRIGRYLCRRLGLD